MKRSNIKNGSSVRCLNVFFCEMAQAKNNVFFGRLKFFGELTLFWRSYVLFQSDAFFGGVTHWLSNAFLAKLSFWRIDAMSMRHWQNNAFLANWRFFSAKRCCLAKWRIFYTGNKNICFKYISYIWGKIGWHKKLFRITEIS